MSQYAAAVFIIGLSATLVGMSGCAGGTMPGCPAGAGKLIDRAQPEKSLLYTKMSGQSPGGTRMPVGNYLSDAEMSCFLNWIKSVASEP